MSGLVCRSCGNPINKKEKYVGYKRPTGFSVMCVKCYEQNGGNSTKIRKRYGGNAEDYFEQNIRGVRATDFPERMREGPGRAPTRASEESLSAPPARSFEYRKLREARLGREKYRPEEDLPPEGGEGEAQIRATIPVTARQIRRMRIKGQRKIPEEIKMSQMAQAGDEQGTPLELWLKSPEYVSPKEKRERIREGLLSPEDIAAGLRDPLTSKEREIGFEFPWGYSISRSGRPEVVNPKALVGWDFVNVFYDDYDAHMLADEIEGIRTPEGKPIYYAAVLVTKTPLLERGRHPKLSYGREGASAREGAVVMAVLRKLTPSGEEYERQQHVAYGPTPREILSSREEWLSAPPVEGQEEYYRMPYGDLPITERARRTEANPVTPIQVVVREDEIGSLSIGMWYKVLNVMAVKSLNEFRARKRNLLQQTLRPSEDDIRIEEGLVRYTNEHGIDTSVPRSETYGPTYGTEKQPPVTYYIVAGKDGVIILDAPATTPPLESDIAKSSIQLLIPYSYLYKIKQHLENLEDNMKYTKTIEYPFGKPLNLPWFDLYHRIAPEEEKTMPAIGGRKIAIYKMMPPANTVPLMMLPDGSEIGYMIVPKGGLMEPGGFRPYMERYGRRESGPLQRTKEGAIFYWLEQGYTLPDEVMARLAQPQKKILFHFPDVSRDALPQETPEPIAYLTSGPKEDVVKEIELWRDGLKSAGIRKSRDAGIRGYIDTGERYKEKVVTEWDNMYGTCIRCGGTKEMKIPCPIVKIKDEKGEIVSETGCDGVGQIFDARLRKLVPCEKCNGTGIKMVSCEKCNATGIMKLPVPQWTEKTIKIIDSPRIIIGPTFNYEQQAIEWIIQHGIPLNMEAVATSKVAAKIEKAAERAAARAAFAALSAADRAAVRKARTQVIPLSLAPAPSAPSSSIPLSLAPLTLEAAAQPQPELLPAPDTCVHGRVRSTCEECKNKPEQNPLGLLEMVVGGIATGAASGATFAVVNNGLNGKKKRRKRGG